MAFKWLRWNKSDTKKDDDAQVSSPSQPDVSTITTSIENNNKTEIDDDHAIVPLHDSDEEQTAHMTPSELKKFNYDKAKAADHEDAVMELRNYCKTQLIHHSEDTASLMCDKLMTSNEFALSMRCFSRLHSYDYKTESTEATATLCKNLKTVQGYDARLQCMKMMKRSEHNPTHTTSVILCGNLQKFADAAPVVKCWKGRRSMKEYHNATDKDLSKCCSHVDSDKRKIECNAIKDLFT